MPSGDPQAFLPSFLLGGDALRCTTRSTSLSPQRRPSRRAERHQAVEVEVGRLVITPLGEGRFTIEVIRGADKWAIQA